MSIPRSLEELIGECGVKKGFDVESAIERHSWASKFLSDLNQRRLDDEITALKFLVLTKSLDEANNNAKRYNSELFLEAGRRFFHEDSETIICLNNDKLFEKISEAVRRVKGEITEVTSEDITLMAKAREDFNLTINGLEPLYLSFVKRQPTSGIACLLSILWWGFTIKYAQNNK